MKPCIYYEPKGNNLDFEGARLRKNLRSALEISHISYARSVIDTYDLIHFISLNDELKINDISETNIPIVFSALYCESDDNAKTINSNNYNVLSQKAIRILNKVDLILVNDEASKKFLIVNGIKKVIKVVTAGINLARFESINKLEDDIFYNYYQVDKNKKYVVSISNSNNKELVKKISSIAEKCPNLLFFHFSPNLTKAKNQNYKHLKNLNICPILNEELYISMMKNATIYLSLENERHSPLTLLDAMASKTQIISLDPSCLNEEMLNGCKAYHGKNEDEISKIINQLINNELQYTTQEAYEYAKKNSIQCLNKDLIEIYEKLLREKKDDRSKINN